MRHLTWLHLGTYNGLNFQFLGFKQIPSLSRVELDVFYILWMLSLYKLTGIYKILDFILIIII